MSEFSDLLIVSDLDNTFLGDGRIIERNIKALEHFKKNGGSFTFATGRMHHVLELLIPQTASLVNFPAITGNGSYIYDYEKRESLCENFLDSKVLPAIIKDVYENFPHFAIKLNSLGKVYTPIKNKRFDLCLTPKEEYGIFDIDEFPDKSFAKVVFNAKADELSVLYERMKDVLPESVTASYSCPVLLELLDAQATKGKRIPELKRISGNKKIIAMGDYDNDLQMLEAADYAFCPSNANERVKAVCDGIFCDARQGCIADVIEKIESRDIIK